MGVHVAEYFGQRTDVSSPIAPAYIPTKKDDPLTPKCPFSSGNTCRKLKSKYEPVCSVRTDAGDMWIVCPERLCTTKKDLPLCAHQQEILTDIANHVFKPGMAPDDICVKREESLSVFGSGTYHADYIMTTKTGQSGTSGPDRLVLEMQGGGETTDTGPLTKNVKAWRNDPNRDNAMLRKRASTSPLPANAWRRQQEQFLVKGDVAMKTWKGLGIAFCVGTILYDYIMEKVRPASIPNLKDYNWTLCLMAIKEDTSNPPAPGPIPLIVDEDRILYTNYQTFVQALINRGEPTLDAFEGEFISLTNVYYVISF